MADRNTFAASGRSTTGLYSTAYNGSEGYINDIKSLPDELDQDVFDNEQLSVPAKALTNGRPALGSRLLSSAQQASAGLSRSGSILHSRAKSLASFVPKLNANNSTAPDPAPSSQQSNKLFGDLFNGESAPIRLGIPPSSPTKEETEFIMDYQPSFTPRPNTNLRRRSTAQTHVSQPSTSSTKTSWFSRKSTTPAAPPTTTRAANDILNIDINSALFPTGPADPMSPHAFNDLLLNATSLLQRMQTAYKEKVDYIASVRPEIDAQKEEVEEAETRSRHLKMQLEDMSYKAEEQNKAMRELALQLAAEKVRAQEAEDAAQRTVRLVRQEDEEDEHQHTPRSSRGKRTSAGSQASDSGFESDLDYADSIMSSAGALSPPPPAAMTGVRLFAAAAAERPTGGEGAAWATVETLRSENRHLRSEMEGMQRSLQGVIDFVGGVKG